MVSAGYSGLKVSPSSGFFICCMEPKTHEYSQSLGRLLGRAAVVSAIIERIERMASSTKEAGLFHKLTAKSRPSKKCCCLAEPGLRGGGKRWKKFPRVGLDIDRTKLPGALSALAIGHSNFCFALDRATGSTILGAVDETRFEELLDAVRTMGFQAAVRSAGEPFGQPSPPQGRPGGVNQLSVKSAKKRAASAECIWISAHTLWTFTRIFTHKAARTVFG
jgi:hypothetical protein